MYREYNNIILFMIVIKFFRVVAFVAIKDQ